MQWMCDFYTDSIGQMHGANTALRGNHLAPTLPEELKESLANRHREIIAKLAVLHSKSSCHATASSGFNHFNIIACRPQKFHCGSSCRQSALVAGDMETNRTIKAFRSSQSYLTEMRLKISEETMATLCYLARSVAGEQLWIDLLQHVDRGWLGG